MMKKYLARGVCNLTAVGVAAGLSVTALPLTAVAQNALEEILVTARKREENLQEVPVSISVFTGEGLEEAGISSTRDLFDNTPGLNFDTSFDANAATPAIRGVGSSEIATYRQKVTSFLDGMPILGQQGTVPFLAIQQVEVLRGPQSAAFGRSTFGGAINYTTRDPGDLLQAEFSADVGSNDKQDFGALVSGPLITGLLSGLITGSSTRRDGEDEWKTIAEGFVLGGEKSEAVMAKLILTPGESTSIEFRYKWQEVDNDPTPRVFLNVNDPHRRVHPDNPTPLTTCGIQGRPSCAYVGEVNPLANPTFNQNFAATGITDPFVRNDRERYELQLTQDFANGMSFEAMGFASEEFYERASDSDLANNAAGFERDPTNIDESYAEVRLTSAGAGRFRYGFGASWYDYDFETNIYRSLVGYQTNVPTQQFQESATNLGYFFNTAFDFNDQWTASLEGRYQVDEVTGTSRFGNSLTQETEAFLPRVALTFTPSGDTTYYAQVAMGNNPAGVNAGVLNPSLIEAARLYPQYFNPADPAGFEINDLAFYDEEEVLSYEIGMKGTAYNRLSYSVSAYLLDWEGFTQPFNLNYEPLDFVDANPDDGIGDAGSRYAGLSFSPGRTFLAAGDVTGLGAEIEATYLATDNFTVGFGASFVDITYDDNACSTTPNTNYGVPVNATTENGLRCVSVAGNRLGTQPEFTALINLTYNLPLTNGMEWFTRWNTVYNGSQFATEMNLEDVGAYSISSLRTGLTRGSWRAEVYADNLFDEDATQGVTVNPDGRIVNTVTGAALPPTATQNVAYTVRRGVSFGLRLSYRL